MTCGAPPRVLTTPSLLAVLAAVSVGLAARPAAQERRPTPPQKLFDWTRLDFPSAEYRARRQALIARLRRSGGGVFLAPSAEGTSHGETFRQLDDFFYFTGLEVPRSVLAIDADRETVTLFVPSTDARFSNPARRNDFPGRRLATDPALRQRTGLKDVRRRSQLDESLRRWGEEGRLLRVHAGRTGAVPTPASEPVRDWRGTDALVIHLREKLPGLRLESAAADVGALRAVKSPAEIAVLRRACGITSSAIRAAAGAIAPGIDERSLEGVLESGFKRGGAQRTAFHSIIKSGPNSLWPWRILAAHYDRRNRSLRAGELVIFDVGCELDHYASDVGRTFPVSGTFTTRQKELVGMVTRAADAVIAAARPGTTLAELQKIALAEIPADERRYMQAGLFFGHHIGLAVGDPAPPHGELAPGMLFTVEPWYYNHDQDVAVFVEDVVLINETGAENLTASLPRSPDELEKMVGDEIADRASAGQTAPVAADTIRILAYNIHHGAGVDGKLDLARIARVINAQRPDLVALQEIDQGVSRTEKVMQAQRLGALTGMHAAFGEFMGYGGGRYGMALLSRHPVEESLNHRLPDGAEPRSALTARVRIAGTDRRLLFAGIHLYATDAQRLAQARRLVELFENEELPVLLAGDFNSKPGSAVMELLAARWRPAGKRGPRHTFPAPAPDREIDFVLVPRRGPFEVVDCRVIEEAVASDHRPLLAVLRWRR